MTKGSQVQEDRVLTGKQERHVLVTFALAVCLGVIPVQLVRAQTFTILHTFTGGTDGGVNPSVGSRDAAGNLYGVAREGGNLDCSEQRSSGCGVVFQVDAAGNETVLFAFNKPGAIFPGSLTRHAVSNLYGIAGGGGRGLGTVFRVTTNGQEKVLHAFQGGIDGELPTGNLVLDSAGNIFGTTLQGGTGTWGTVFKVHGTAESVLYNFTGGADGGNPYAGVILDAEGNLYGTTGGGGTLGGGTIFKVDTTGQESVLHSFNRKEGVIPRAGLIRDASGSLYGTASLAGGPGCAGQGCGTVFKLTSKGKLLVLHHFTGRPDGQRPYASVIRDSSGDLLGTTLFGGAGSPGNGTIFKVSKSGIESVSHVFTGRKDGAEPVANLLADGKGNFYGTTSRGGVYDEPCQHIGCGTVFELDNTGKETILYNFTGVDGNSPQAGLTQDADGNFYGTTEIGGAFNHGAVFKLTKAGMETVLYSFTGGTDGGTPVAGLVRDATGNLFGTTEQGGVGGGTIFKLDKAGKETVLHTFTGTDGYQPVAGLIQDGQGNFYGTTYSGGTDGFGTVFKITP